MNKIPDDILKAIRKIKRKRLVRRKDGVVQTYWVLTAPKKGYIRKTRIVTGVREMPVGSDKEVMIMRSLKRK